LCLNDEVKRMSKSLYFASAWLLFGVFCGDWAYGQIVFVDHFDDGIQPVSWRQHGHGPDGAFSIADGNYEVEGPDPTTSETMGIQATDFDLENVSVHAIATIAVGAGNLALKVRGNGEGFFLGYGASISSSGRAFLFRLDGDPTVTPPIILQSVAGLGFNANDEVNLQLNAVGDSLSFTVWPEGLEMPMRPTLEANDDMFSHGAVGFAFAEAQSAPNSKALFREFRAVLIPEPSTLTLTALALLAMFCRRRRRT
jgi:hypothetical protein